MQLPIYLTKIDWNPRDQYITDYILDQHDRWPYMLHPGDASLPLVDNEFEDFKKLYELILQEANSWVGPLELKKTNRKKPWAYVSRRDQFFQGIHDHSHTCEINAIYYHTVPETNSPIANCLGLYNDNNQLKFWFKPRNGDLIMYPGWLKHQPIPPDTQEWRIAINMEIDCQLLWPKNMYNF